MASVNCTSCGRTVDLPEGYSRAKIRCPGCGYYAEVPTESRSGAREPAVEAPVPPAPAARDFNTLPTARRSSPAKPAESPAPPPPEDRRESPTEADESGPYDPLTSASYGFSEPVSKPKPAPAPRRSEASVPRAAKPQRDPRDPRPNFDADEPGGQPLLQGTQDEEDGLPYAVPGTGLQKCPHCRGDLPLTAEFCVHCGRDLATGEKAKKVYQPIYREWVEGYSMATRLQFLVGMQVLNFFVFVLAFLAQELTFRDYGAILTNLFFAAIQVGLQAFLVGTYDTIQVQRNAKGQTTITRIRRIAFYPFPPQKISWKQHCMVGTMGTHDPDLFAWLVCAYLLLFACLPAIIFYWFVIRPERFTVNFTNEYGNSEAVVFRTKDREQAYEVAELLSECTRLTLKRLL